MKFKILIIALFVYSAGMAQVKYTYYKKAVLESDLAFFYDKVTTIHPLFAENEYLNKWNLLFNAAKQQLTDSMTQNEFYLVVSPLLAALNDGHSNFSCPFEQRKIFMGSGGLSFPFMVKISGNSVFISEYFGTDSINISSGSEILKINNRSITDILAEMRKTTGGNTISMQNKTIETFFRLYLWICFGFEGNYELEIKNTGNNVKNVLVKGATQQQFNLYRQTHTSTEPGNYSLLFMPDNKISVLTIRSFGDLNGFCTFADSAFKAIAINKTEHLIIDIRGNGGGRSIVVDSLMNYLSGKPYSQYKKIQTRISADLKDYWKNNYPPKYESIKNYATNKIITTEIKKEIPQKKEYKYTGKMYLLTNNTSFSAAATFAGVFKELKAGVIIGEETGGTIEYFGDFWNLYLPGTGLEFRVAPKRFVQYGGKDANRGVMPDYVVPDNGNSIMDFTLKLIKKSR